MFFFIEESKLIRGEVMIESENHHFEYSNEILCIGNGYQCLLKPFRERFLGKFERSFSLTTSEPMDQSPYC